MAHMLIFGLGYTGERLAARLRSTGWLVSAARRAAGEDVIDFGDSSAIRSALNSATHILSSVPPGEAGDPVLSSYGREIAASSALWTGYLSSTGVYGDTGGAWVDESAATGGGRRSARARADADWAALRADVRIFRLPGIYGPGRSALDRVRDGRAQRVHVPGQVFSRVHVDDIVSGVIAGFDGPPGIYNLADDLPCPQNQVIEAASAMLGVPPPPLEALDNVDLSPQARAFYSENRRVANGKAKRLLGWKPLYPTFWDGLASCL
ncbi:MAG TPA: SDR family NAD(P)-dependent oxidoreductase [Sphingobium sp.]